jgi:hypothetical protein
MSKKFERLFFILVPLLAFILLSVLIIYQRVGVSEYKTEEANVKYIEPGAVLSYVSDSPDECLFIYSSNDSTELYKNLTFTLDEMCVDYSEFDTQGVSELPDLASFETVVIALSSGDVLIPYINTIMDWVKSGGHALFAGVPGPTVTELYPIEFGLQVSEWTYVPQEKVSFDEDFYIGSEGEIFKLVEDGATFLGGKFLLSPNAKVYMTSSGSQGSTPMVWSNEPGEGKITVINYDALSNRNTRGIFVQAYAHAAPIAMWPVINASAFFIDNFPVPVPDGTSEFINRDYGVTVDYFYTNIWWPDIQEIGEKHGIRYTGIFIEGFDDNTKPPFERSTELSKQRYFGQMLLSDGNEMGTRGLNNQPLVYDNFVYKADEEYNPWGSADDIIAGLNESQSLISDLYGGYVPEVYAPAANIWTDELRTLIKDNFPNIKVFSGLYNDNTYNLSQDFEVADDGLINFPRIVSNSILTDYDHMFMLSEMNFHFVNSHYIHPDDALDENRGAGQGWEAMRDSYETIVKSVTGTGMRQLTASEAAAAVQRFDNLDVEFTYTETAIDIQLGGFYDEAYLLVRTNDMIPGKVTGGELTNVSGSLYLLRADSAKVHIALQN